MIRAMWLESPRFNPKPFSEAKALRLIGLCLSGGTFGGFVADLDGVLVGMIAGALVDELVTDGCYVTDMAVYVTPEKRGSSIFPRMARVFEDWAFNEVGADEVLLGISTGVHPEKTVYVYERLGYTMTGQALIKSKEAANVQPNNKSRAPSRPNRV